VTRSPGYVLGVQGADCPSIFLYDEAAQVIGLAHAGWKPVVRGVVRNTVGLMVKLGASPSGVRAFIGPGVGDRFNEFQWDEAMEPPVRDVFITARREDLLTDRSIRYEMTDEDCEQVRVATGRDIRGGTALELAGLIVRNLVQEGVERENIDVSGHSTICERSLKQGIESAVYRYHSARRDAGKDPERPGFGVNLCVLFLKDLP
jgi:copper oxidase (laccase) domain-containing protein